MSVDDAGRRETCCDGHEARRKVEVTLLVGAGHASVIHASTLNGGAHKIDPLHGGMSDTRS